MTAAILRCGVVAYVLCRFGPAWFFSRGMEMGLLADSINHGMGLSSPFGPFTGPTAMIAPGYPLLTSAFFRALGAFTWKSAICLMLLNVVCNSATSALIYKLSRRIATERSAFIAAMFWACSMPLLWMPTIFWETSLSSMLLLGVISAAVARKKIRSWQLWPGFGCICAVASLINPSLILSFAAIGVYALTENRVSGKPWRDCTACCIGFIVVFSAWPLRNAVTMHSLVFTRTTVGLELWMGNRPGSDGYLEASLFPTYNSAELELYKQIGEIRYMDQKANKARVFIKAQPLAFLRLSCRRVARFWLGSGTRSGSWLFSLHGTLTCCAGLCGLWSIRREGKTAWLIPVVLPLLIFPLPYYITHAEFRYRLVVDPLLVAAGARALDVLFLWRQNGIRIVSRERALLLTV